MIQGYQSNYSILIYSDKGVDKYTGVTMASTDTLTRGIDHYIFHITMPSVMSFTELPSQLPWPLRERCLIWFPLQTSRHPPPYLEPWSARCSGHSCHLISSATEDGRGCLRPWPCPAGWRPTQTGVSPLSLPIGGAEFHPHCD